MTLLGTSFLISYTITRTFTSNTILYFLPTLDSRFFVAIPPALRMDWGKQMAKLIKPGGHLITVVYPIDPYVETGPPYYVRQDHYVEPLGNDFSKILDKVPEESSENHKDREHLIIWKRL